MNTPLSNNPNPNDPISIIIPTVNAYEELDLALTSIEKNSDHPTEIIVVVDPDKKTGKINSRILSVCKKHNITPIINKKNKGPYGNWNIGARKAKYDWLIFATDDQYFAPHWDSNLLQYWKPKRFVAGRLVEPGIIPVWKTNIQQDFGVTPKEFREQDFLNWCIKQTQKGFKEDGFFIPLLQHKKDFNDLGGYPTKGEFGTSGAVSNDISYIENAKKQGYEFGTATNSYSYHFQASSWKKKTLKPKIAGLILTLNAEKYIKNAIKSLSWVNDVIIVDSGSTDNTIDIAKKLGCKIHKHEFKDFASQRNFALSKLKSYDWVLMLDADEELEDELIDELTSFSKDIYLDGVEIPRKNYIFGQWIEHTDWYPDYRLVFFRPKMVQFTTGVHERAQFIKGNGAVVKAKSHIIHHNYDTVEEFVLKNLITYPKAYAKHLLETGYKLKATDFIQKPISEFMRRFFLSEGYKDGFYGLVLSTLMSAQVIASYAYLWEMKGKKKSLSTKETNEIFNALRNQFDELKYWVLSLKIETSEGAKKLMHRVQRKIQSKSMVLKEKIRDRTRR